MRTKLGILFFIISLYSLSAHDSLLKTNGHYSLKYILNNNGGIHVKWLYKAEDNSEFTKITLDDESWTLVNTSFTKGSNSVPLVSPSWFRIHLLIDTLKGSAISIMMNHTGASEIYANGKLLKSFGVVSSLESEEVRYQPAYSPVFIDLPDSDSLTLAIRYSNTKILASYNNEVHHQSGFGVVFMKYDEAVKSTISASIPYVVLGIGLSIFFLTLSIFHMVLYLFYKTQRSNLIYSVLCIMASYFTFQAFIITLHPSVSVVEISRLVSSICGNLFFYLLPYLVAVIFHYETNKILKYLKFTVLLNLLLVFLIPSVSSIIFGVILCVSIILIITFLIKSLRSGIKGARILFFGFGFFVLMLSIVVVISKIAGELVITEINVVAVLFFLAVFLSIIGIPLSMTMLLAKEFSYTSRTLELKLVEVEELSVKTIQQEKEKQKILATQNEMLEVQVKERTTEIEEQKKLIEEKNKDITDSINYAQRIQQSVLPTEKEIKDIFPQSLVLFKPRDIVSGDFYQFKQNGEHKFVILADCTGHGVPGALMSMVGSNLLKQIIMERNILKPNLVLSALHKEVKSTLRQNSGTQSHDGMDISICMVHENELFISSANRPVYLISENEVLEIKPDKKSIGGASTLDDIEFTLHRFKIDKPFKVYMFSDGYADQFGGPAGKKFKIKNLHQLIMSNVNKPFTDQLQILNSSFEEWKGLLEQVDDVSLLAVELNRK